MNDYNKLIDKYNLYEEFTFTEDWDVRLRAIAQVSPEIAEAIREAGIGKRLTDDGQYDFDSEQLLQAFPDNIRDSRVMKDLHQEVCGLANAYAYFVRSQVEQGNETRVLIARALAWFQ